MGQRWLQHFATLKDGSKVFLLLSKAAAAEKRNLRLLSRRLSITSTVLDCLGGRFFGEGRQDVAEDWADMALRYEGCVNPATEIERELRNRDYFPANAEKISAELVAILRGHPR